MKPLSSKPSDACGASPINGFSFVDASGRAIKAGGDLNKEDVAMVPLCQEHLEEAKKAGAAVAVNLGDPNLEANREMTCHHSTAKRETVPPVFKAAPVMKRR